MVKHLLTLTFSFLLILPLRAQDQLTQKAFTLLEEENYEQAEKLFEQVIPLFYKQKDYNAYANAYSGLLGAKFELEKDDEFFEIVNRELPRIKSLPYVSDSTIAKFYTRLGDIHRVLGDFKEAETAYNLAYRLLEKFKHSEPFSNTIAGLAYLFKKRGDINASIEYFQSAISSLHTLNKRKNDIIAYQNNIAILYQLNLDFPQSIEWLYKSLTQTQSLTSEVSQKDRLQSIYLNLGYAYYAMNQFDSAKYWYHKNILFSKRHNLSLNKIYNNLSLTLIAEGNPQKAFNYIDKSHHIRMFHSKGNKSIDLAKIYRTYGDAYICLKQYDSALWYLQKSLIHFFPEFNDTSIYKTPSLNTTNSESVLLYSLTHKAIAFTGKALQSNIEKDRELAIATFWKSTELIEKMRQLFESQGSKSNLAKRTWWVFEAAIESCMKLYKATQNPKYQEFAFQFAEKSKSVLLQDAITESLAKQNLGLPDSLLSFELALKKEIAQLENHLYQAQKGRKEEKTNKIRPKLLKKREELRLFGLSLEKQFPNYFQMKYQKQPTNLRKIQQQLTPQQAIIEYFVGDKTVYCFVITSNKLFIQQFDYFNLVEPLVKKLRDNIQPRLTNQKQAYQHYVQVAYQLYQSILEDCLKELPNQVNTLTIIPDGTLCHFPFELLLTQSADIDIPDYRQLDYLIKSYEINYAFNALSLYQSFPHASNKSKHAVLAFAPSYSQIKNDSSQASLGIFRDQVTPLKWNTKEVEHITPLIPTTSFLNQLATEAEFKKQAAQYQVIHLAMHALTDHENPMQSRLVFSQDSTTSEDSYLHVYELLNMELNADLAILSACNTGVGKYIRGQGLASLGNAFAYAGCPSVIASHWSVDDQATAQLMDTFYEGLSKGLNKSQALYEAKLNYLKTAGPHQANPFYWSSFILIGDTHPIISKSHTWWYAGIGMLLFTLISYRFLTSSK